MRCDSVFKVEPGKEIDRAQMCGRRTICLDGGVCCGNPRGQPQQAQSKPILVCSVAKGNNSLEY